jgi:hypothetical protein
MRRILLTGVSVLTALSISLVQMDALAAKCTPSKEGSRATRA